MRTMVHWMWPELASAACAAYCTRRLTLDVQPTPPQPPAPPAPDPPVPVVPAVRVAPPVPVVPAAPVVPAVPVVPALPVVPPLPGPPQSQVDQVVPSARQLCAPAQTPGPTHDWVLPGMQTRPVELPPPQDV